MKGRVKKPAPSPMAEQPLSKRYPVFRDERDTSAEEERWVQRKVSSAPALRAGALDPKSSGPLRGPEPEPEAEVEVSAPRSGAEPGAEAVPFVPVEIDFDEAE